jgi:rubrerythrin
MSSSDEIGNVLPHEVDELTHYIFKNYSGLMTPAEKSAYLALIVGYKAEHYECQNMKGHLRARSNSTEPEVVTLLEQGAREFYIATRNRILRDHGKDIFLNHCPKCGALARTPKACLCPACSHTWFEERRG